MSDYEKVMEYLRTRCDEIMGEWNGDLPGQDEDNAYGAKDLLELLDKVDELVKELDI